MDRPQLDLANPHLQDKAIIRLAAPGGFGKSSLLCQWRRKLLATGAVVAWVTVDAADDSVRFTQALSLAMERASGRPAFARIRHRAANTRDNIDCLTERLGTVADTAAKSTIMLDEVDQLPTQTTQASLNYLMRNLPPNLHVVLAGRRRTSLQIADLVDRGLVADLAAASLRFSLRETGMLLDARLQTRVNADLIANIHELTDGWPLGIQLAISTMAHGQPDARSLLERSPKRRTDIKAYLVQALLGSLPATEREFLALISIVDRVQGALCAALTGRRDATQLLNELRESTPLSLDALDSDWSTIHPVARESLNEQFDLLPRKSRRLMHARAAHWLADHGLEEEAARHALKAGQNRRAWLLAEKSLFNTFVSGRESRVRDWFERLPLPAREQRPQLLLAAE